MKMSDAPPRKPRTRLVLSEDEENSDKDVAGDDDSVPSLSESERVMASIGKMSKKKFVAMRAGLEKPRWDTLPEALRTLKVSLGSSESLTVPVAHRPKSPDSPPSPIRDGTPPPIEVTLDRTEPNVSEKAARQSSDASTQSRQTEDKPMILIGRRFYNMWESMDGRTLYSSRRYTQLPYVCHAVEYMPDGSVHRVLPWSKSLHDKLIGMEQPYNPDIKNYRLESRELVVYRQLLTKRVVLEARAKPLGSCDPAILAASGGPPNEIREARIMKEIRYACTLKNTKWIHEKDIAPIMIKHLDQDMQNLISAKLVWVHGKHFALAGSGPPKSLPPPASDPGILRFDGVTIEKLREMLKSDKKRLLAVSSSGQRSLEPKGMNMVRLLDDHPPFKKGNIVCISSISRDSFVAEAKKTRERMSKQFAYNWTNPAAVATYDDLAYVHGDYDGIVIFGRSVPFLIIERCVAIVGGDVNRCIIVDL